MTSDAEFLVSPVTGRYSTLSGAPVIVMLSAGVVCARLTTQVLPAPRPLTCDSIAVGTARGFDGSEDACATSCPTATLPDDTDPIVKRPYDAAILSTGVGACGRNSPYTPLPRGVPFNS